MNYIDEQKKQIKHGIKLLLRDRDINTAIEMLNFQHLVYNKHIYKLFSCVPTHHINSNSYDNIIFYLFISVLFTFQNKHGMLHKVLKFKDF